MALCRPLEDLFRYLQMHQNGRWQDLVFVAFLVLIKIRALTLFDRVI